MDISRLQSGRRIDFVLVRKEGLAIARTHQKTLDRARGTGLFRVEIVCHDGQGVADCIVLRWHDRGRLHWPSLSGIGQGNISRCGAT
jgi:hypothetical protein